jgi:hypothetical protein
MKIKLTKKQKAELVAASRIALQIDQGIDFWAEVEQLFEDDQLAALDLVESREEHTIK